MPSNFIMNMKAQIIFKFIFFSTACLYAAQHLEPEYGFFPNGASSYDRNINEILLKDASKYSLGLAVSLPSFQPEWAVSLEKTEEKNFKLCIFEAAQAIYNSKNPKAIEIKKRQLLIDKDLGEMLHSVWVKVLFNTRYSREDPSGLDGTAYHFFCWESESRFISGMTWSPDESSEPGRFVKLIYSLRELVSSTPSEKQKLIVEVTKEAKSLL